MKKSWAIGTLGIILFLFIGSLALAGSPINVEISDVTIIIDGNPDDWAGIPAYAQDPMDDLRCETGPDLKAVYFAKDSQYLYWRMDSYSGEIGSDYHPTIHFYQNTDGKSDHDIQVRAWGDRDSGVIWEYTDQDGFVKQYTGSEFGKINSVAEGKIPLSFFSGKQIIKISAHFYNRICTSDYLHAPFSLESVPGPGQTDVPFFGYFKGVQLYYETRYEHSDDTGVNKLFTWVAMDERNNGDALNELSLEVNSSVTSPEKYWDYNGGYWWTVTDSPLSILGKQFIWTCGNQEIRASIPDDVGGKTPPVSNIRITGGTESNPVIAWDRYENTHPNLRNNQYEATIFAIQGENFIEQKRIFKPLDQPLIDFSQIDFEFLSNQTYQIRFAIKQYLDFKNITAPDGVWMNVVNRSVIYWDYELAPCTYSISPTSGNFPTGGGTDIVKVTTSDPDCTWTASENLSWASLSPTSGGGSQATLTAITGAGAQASVTVTVDPNTGDARNGSAAIAGYPYNISQVGASDQTAVILTRTSPNHTITSGSDVKVYGTAVSNQITLESGAQTELINFPGFNTVQFQSSADGFTVSRSGQVVTFQGADGTVLKIPANQSVQTITFAGQEPLTLNIYNNQVMLDDQVITVSPVPIINGKPEKYLEKSTTNEEGKAVFQGILPDGSDLVVECGQETNFAKKVSGLSVTVALNYENLEGVVYVKDSQVRYFPSSTIINLADSHYKSNSVMMSMLRASGDSILSFRKSIIFNPTLGEYITTLQLNELGNFLFEKEQVTQYLFLGQVDSLAETALVDIYKSPIPQLLYIKPNVTSLKRSKIQYGGSNNSLTEGVYGDSLLDISKALDNIWKGLVASIKGFANSIKQFKKDVSRHDGWIIEIDKVDDLPDNEYRYKLTSSGIPDNNRQDIDEYIIDWGDGTTEPQIKPTNIVDGITSRFKRYHTYKTGFYDIKVTLKYYMDDSNAYKDIFLTVGSENEIAEKELEYGLDKKYSDPVSAISHFSKVINILEGNGEWDNFLIFKALYNRGQAYYRIDDCQNAIVDLQKLIQNDWDIPWGHGGKLFGSSDVPKSFSRILIGNCYESMGEYDLSLIYYEEALDKSLEIDYPVGIEEASQGIDRINALLQKPLQPLQLDRNRLSLEPGESSTVNIIGGTGYYISAESSDANVSTAILGANNTVMITGVFLGSAVITVADSNNQTATITVIVEETGDCKANILYSFNKDSLNHYHSACHWDDSEITPYYYFGIEVETPGELEIDLLSISMASLAGIELYNDNCQSLGQKTVQNDRAFYITLDTGTYYIQVDQTADSKDACANVRMRFAPSGTAPHSGDCGAYITPTEWKEFDCYNLGAAGRGTHPWDEPSWKLIGGYWQWGRKGSEGFNSNTEHFAHGPTGPGSSEANSGAISGWDSRYAPDEAWSDPDNDPCPTGYRVPTINEWKDVLANNDKELVGSSWSSSATNYDNGLKVGKSLFLPSAGLRSDIDSGALSGRGYHGSYWSSSIYGLYHFAGSLGFSPHSDPGAGFAFRNDGLSVRCISGK